MKNYFIIDNGDDAVGIIKTVLNEFSEIRCVGISDNQNHALNLILKNSPDIIFFNIDNTIDNLLEFLFDLNQYSNKIPVLIALSSDKNSAYKAFKYDFFDYLLKPLTELCIRKCMLRYHKKHPVEPIKTICLKSYKDYHYINTDEILFLKADNNTTDFHLSDGSVVGAYKTLKTFENMLPQNFLRIHKSYIINSHCITRIHYGKSLCIIKNNSHKIPFTKTFINNINFINTALSNNAFIALN